MPNVNVKGLIKEASAAIDEKNAIRDKVAALREILRFSVQAGEATEEEAAWIAEAFPARQRGVEANDEE